MPSVVPQARALAAHELDRQARVGADHARALELLELGQAHDAFLAMSVQGKLAKDAGSVACS